MSLRRSAITLMVGALAAIVATIPAGSASAEPAVKPQSGAVPKSTAPAAKAKGNATGKLAGKHSLRAPVTDENFYFVMADRFENGKTANDTGGISGGPTSRASIPRTRASTTAVI